MTVQKHTRLVLRLGLAFVFGWFGIDKFFYVANWYGWVPGWLTFVPRDFFLYAVGGFEVVLALLLVVNRFVRVAALLCAGFLLGVVFTFGINEIVVRDIGLIAMALALAMQPEQRKFHELHRLQELMKRHRAK